MPARCLALATALALAWPACAAEPASSGASSCGALDLARGLLTPSLPPPAAQPKSASDPYQAAQQGIDWLMGSLCTWMQGEGLATDCASGRTGSCMGCHVQAETVLGLARSRKRCYSMPTTACSGPADESPLEFVARFVAGCQRKPCIVGTFSRACGVPAQDVNTLDGYYPELGSIGHYPDCGSNAPPASVHPIMQSAHGGLALAGYSSYVAPTYSANLVDLASWFVTKQQPDGHWIPDRNEAPVDQGEVFVAAAAVKALRTATYYTDAATAAIFEDAILRASDWLRRAPRVTTQDRTFAVLGLLDAGVRSDDPDLQLVVNELLASQQPDGGWAERAGLQSNAYATGQALDALMEAGVPVDDPPTCAGIGWLMGRQNADGSWSLGTPGIDTDSSRNSSFTATIWPVLALGSLRPWGARVQATTAGIVTCEDHAEFSVQVAHAADTACGLFARPDTYDLSAYSDTGDPVTVVPSSVSLAAGGAEQIAVTWFRTGGPRPAGSVSNITLMLASEGAAAAGCPLFETSPLVVSVPDDPLPGPLGGLKVKREGSDLRLDWGPAADPAGAFDVVSLERPFRADATVRPTKAVLDASGAHATVDASLLTALLPGEGTPAGSELIFYKVRALSPCLRAPGPTCDVRTCSDPEACWPGCR